jgi:hypothetical protein
LKGGVVIKKNPNIIQLNLFPPRTGMDCLGRVLMLGGGVQSMAMVDMISVGKIPPVDLVIFADTTLEPWYVYQAIGWARSALVKVGIPLKVVKADCGTNHWAYEGGYGFQVRASMPYWTFSEEGKRGRLRRQCTPELKIAQIIEPYDTGSQKKVIFLCPQGGNAREVRSGGMELGRALTSGHG